MTIVSANALVEFLKTHTVLKRAVVHQIMLGDDVIFVRHAHGEAEISLWVRVEVCGAELEDVTHALARAVFAEDTVVVVCSAVTC